MNVPGAQKPESRQAEEGAIGPLEADQTSLAEPESKRRGHGRWMMIACCIPMLVIAIVLVATGVAGSGFIVAAVGCTAMMAMMMVGMSSAGRGGGDGSGQ